MTKFPTEEIRWKAEKYRGKAEVGVYNTFDLFLEYAFDECNVKSLLDDKINKCLTTWIKEELPLSTLFDEIGEDIADDTEAKYEGDYLEFVFIETYREEMEKELKERQEKGRSIQKGIVGLKQRESYDISKW